MENYRLGSVKYGMKWMYEKEIGCLEKEWDGENRR
jgi:hypothetical protein